MLDENPPDLGGGVRKIQNIIFFYLCDSTFLRVLCRALAPFSMQTSVPPTRTDTRGVVKKLYLFLFLL